MRFLVFRLFGPMAAWGEAAPGDVRPSNLHPTRSALLGLLAAALGVRRADSAAHQALADELSFGVLVDSVGVPVADFHTAQLRKPSKRWAPRTRSEQLAQARHELMTVPSHREYRCDALADVAVWSEAEAPRYGLDELADALRRPAFTLYLGRKACPPSLPLAPRVVEADTLVDAFASARNREEILPAHQLTGRDVTGAVGLFWQASDRLEAGVDAQQIFERRDDPLSRTRRTFRARWEHYAPVPRPFPEPTNKESSHVSEPADPGR